MAKAKKPEIGAITWTDLTVQDATKVRDFYRDVVGWAYQDLDMGGYSDYSMNQVHSGKTVAGICHARDANAKLPPQWLIYITVADLSKSLRKCRALGGKVVTGPRGMNGGRLAVIQDPAGAMAALFQPAAD